MTNKHPNDTCDIIIAARLWLMHRYQQTRCARLARMVELHLGWMQQRSSHPVLANACRRLADEWRAQADSVSTPALH
ncbi:MAG: hypothetical protein WAK92_10755 [Thiobacillus sp.]